MDMMTRRRAMMAGIALPEWDVEWDGTMGLPGNNGFDASVVGNASQTLLTQSVRTTSNNSSSYVQYNYGSNAVIGVLETSLRIGSASGSYYLARFGNGSNEISVRMQYTSSYKGIYLRNASAIDSMTKLKTITTGTTYKIKLVLKATTADVYIDDALSQSDVALSDIPYSSSYKGVYYQSTSASNQSGVVYSMKLKLGRTS